MKDIRFLQLITGIFKFKLIKDERGNEYILNSDNPLNSVGLIEDKTAFEASENHTHIIEKVRTADFEAACSVGQALGELLFHSLKREYRDKEIVVFVSVTVGDSLIIRFHQKWAGEPYYYDVNADYGRNTKIYIFE